MTVLLTALLSIAAHLTLSWEATVLAGLVGGLLSRRFGWFVGACGTALGWGVLVLYTAWAAPASLDILLDTIGALAGNIPGEALVGLSVFLGALLGALGGGIGTILRPLVATRRPAD
jgi:hypothetical protein